MEIKFNDVSYIYNENSPIKTEALKNINISIKEGKVNAIIGPSGSGKTTFVELITALLLPTDGTITIGNFILSKHSKLKNINELRFNIGLVFQFPEEQFFKATVKEEIEFGMKYFKYKIDIIEKRVIDALHMVELDETYLNRNPFTLSSGEQKKVAIASVLAFNPKIIILDEPTVGLDSKGKNNLIKLIRKLKMRYNKTIIIISHDVDLLYQISDYFILLNNGKLIKESRKEETFNDIKLLKENNIALPRVVEFINYVKEEKNKTLDDYDNINDLIKTVYRNVG